VSRCRSGTRSWGASTSRSGRAATTGSPESAPGGAAAGRKVKRRNKVIRSVETKRTKHGAKCVVELAGAGDLDSLSVWLKHDERIVASGSRRVHGKRVALTLRTHKRLRKGVYELDVIALSAEGEQHSRKIRARLR